MALVVQIFHPFLTELSEHYNAADCDMWMESLKCVALLMAIAFYQKSLLCNNAVIASTNCSIFC